MSNQPVIEYDIKRDIRISPKKRQWASTLTPQAQQERKKKNVAARSARKRMRGIISKPVSTVPPVDATKYYPVGWYIERLDMGGRIFNGQLLCNDGSALRFSTLPIGEKMTIYYRDTKN